jgi:lipoprotein-anchoring transpeptidase ErfK/SrfK
MKMTATAGAVSLALLAVAASSASPATAPSRTEPAAPTDRITWVGRVLAPVTARRSPSRTAKAITVVQPIAPLGRGATILQVTGTSRDSDGTLWVRAKLPIRPNEVQGWIPADVMRFNTTPMRIRIDTSARRLDLFASGKRLMRVPVAVGTPQNPTPTGRFAVAEMIRTRTDGAFLGPIVFPMTAYSETLSDFAGGNGRAAIHGTNVPSSVGTRASHGCIRLLNRDIVRLARRVRPGTPIEIFP